jgi:hypothetical protein
VKLLNSWNRGLYSYILEFRGGGGEWPDFRRKLENENGARRLVPSQGKSWLEGLLQFPGRMTYRVGCL